jgi:hypothetical protein
MRQQKPWRKQVLWTLRSGAIPTATSSMSLLLGFDAFECEVLQKMRVTAKKNGEN